MKKKKQKGFYDLNLRDKIVSKIVWKTYIFNMGFSK